MTTLSSEYTVESIIHLYRDSIRTNFDEKIVTLEGFYHGSGKQSYNGVYYDRIYDADKLHNLTIIIKDQQRKGLITGQYYRFNGFINRSGQIAKDGSIRYGFRVTKIVEQLDQHKFISKDEFDLIRQRFDKDSVDIQSYLLEIIRNGKRPNIHIILGSTSIVDADYKSQLNEDHIFNITEERVNFSRSSELLNAFSGNDNQDNDLIVCMRGGGSGLEIFNNTDLANQVVKLQTPFVTALGHKSDLSMTERMADRGFPTPTAFGSFLSFIENIYLSEIQELKEKDTKIKDLNKRIEALEVKHNNDKEELKLLYTELQIKDQKKIKKLSLALLIAFLAIIVLWLILK